MAILNNIKNVLSEKGVMSKWLAKQLQKDPFFVFFLMLILLNVFVILKNSI